MENPTSKAVSQPTVDEAEQLLGELAAAFLATSSDFLSSTEPSSQHALSAAQEGPDYEARYKALIEHIPGVVFVAPLEVGRGNAYVSPQIESLLGFSQEEWLENPIRWYEQLHPEDKQRWSTEAASLFLSGQPLSSTYRVMARDGRVIWFQCDARMVHASDGKPAFIHGIGFDVSELKEAEALLKRAHDELERRVEERTQALARINAQLRDEISEHKRTELLLMAASKAAEAATHAKSEFIANMSHEIRTPLNGVLGLTKLVLKTDLTADQRKYLSVAHDSAESLLGIVNQVLDFAKAESGHAQLQSSAFRLRASLAVLVSELKYHASAKHLDLSYRIAPQVPDSLLGDLGRLRQVLTNLIGNAIKFTASGRVTLDVELDGSVAPQTNGPCGLRFSVADTGIGIAASKMKDIFEPFVQADGSITREFGGTGLGLAICRELVAMMDGQIDVRSGLGFGSTFSFTARFGLALDVADADSSRPWIDPIENAVVSEHSPRSAPVRVLVVDDNPVNRLVATRVIESYGHTVMPAANGVEALKALDKSDFDVVLMDVQMPLMDGLSATRAIRKIEGEKGWPRLPIIALTAHALPADRARCIQAGMDGFLTKPFKSNELMAMMEELASRYSTHNHQIG